MEIGKPLRKIVVEPIREPVPSRRERPPGPAPEPRTAPEPVREPVTR